MFATLATMTQAQAQTGKTSSLDSIIIRESRFQAKYSQYNRDIQILTAKQIAVLPVRSANELLSYAAGVDLRQRGPAGVQSDVSIDGSTFDQVLVLVNGVKMSDPQTGHHLLNIPIPLTAIDHIEILRGPAARVYGVNALAGAINIVTKMPATDAVSAQVYAGSSFTTDTATGDTYVGWGANASGTIHTGKQTHTLSLAHDEGNGYRYNTGFSAYRLFYQNNIAINAKNALDVTGGYIHNDFGANAYYAAPKDAESHETVQTAVGSIGYTWKPNQRFMLKPRISYRYNNDDYIYIRQKPEVYHNIHKTNVLTGELQSSLQLGKGLLGMGAEWRYEDINSTNLGKRDRDNLGLFAEYRYNFSNKLSASAGAYLNNNSIYGTSLFPSADIGYQINRNWKVYANASTGQRLPTYTDLYYKGPLNIGNDELIPEWATYGEVGARYNNNDIEWKGYVFYRRIDDFIDWTRNKTTDPWQPNNFQQINTQGVTTSLSFDLANQLHLQDAYKSQVNIAYTYLEPDIVVPGNESSKYSVEALRHQLIITTANKIHNVLFNLNGRYQYRINGNDYTLLDARIGYAFRHWAVYADVNNILDTQYKEIAAVPLPDRWFTLGVKVDMAK
jgi:iron complex outermembrane receptor protein